MIETIELSKAYGKVCAVDSLTFTAQPGRVTGFLGLNGSGKTTTLRMLLGLTRPTSGQALINGKPFTRLTHPVRQVGAVLEQGISHPGQSGRAHLITQAMLAGTDRARVDTLLEQVGLTEAAHRRTGGYSLGMRQRLAVATALLGEPQVLILDEPANGLDPEGIRWLRGFLRYLSSEGKTVLISSHLLAEVAQTVDDVVIIANGRSVAQGPISDLQGEPTVLVRTPDRDELASALLAAGVVSEEDEANGLRVRTEDMARIGDVALRAGVAVHELRTLSTDLESLYFELTTSPENRNRNLEGMPVQDAEPAVHQGVAS